MKKIKKAFTVIELILIILIIGILTIVAIPRLTATHDDAKIAVAFSSFGVLINEITIFYASYGYFDKNLSQMTSIIDANYTEAFDTNNEKGIITYYTPIGDKVEACLNISVRNLDGNMTISLVSNTQGVVCKGLQQVALEKKLLTTKLLLGNNIF